MKPNGIVFLTIFLFFAGQGASAPAGQIAVLQDEAIDESSGLARHVRNPDFLWTHNDSGDEPRLFLIDRAGRTVGTFHLAGANAVDWEDLAAARVNDRPLLFIGDFGDNGNTRTDCVVYVVSEPDPDAAPSGEPVDVPVEATIPFRYEDGPRNCEALAVDPATGILYLASKEKMKKGGIYELIPEKGGAGPAVARRIADPLLPKITGMDISADGTRAVLLTYLDACLYRRKPDETWAEAFSREPESLPLPERRKGESICFNAEGNVVYLTSEVLPAPLWQIALEP